MEQSEWFHQPRKSFDLVKDKSRGSCLKISDYSPFKALDNVLVDEIKSKLVNVIKAIKPK